MQIQNLNQQKLSLGKTYVKSYAELFAKYISESNKKSDINSKIELSNHFHNDYKKLQNLYEEEKYKLDIQQNPNMHTMISAINYKQKTMIEDMNRKIKEEYLHLKEKLESGKYNFFEKAELKAQYREFKQNLQDETFEEIDKFSISYQNALVRRDNSRIDQLENSLLTNLLSKI